MKTFLCWAQCATLEHRTANEKRLEVVAAHRTSAILTASELLAIPPQKLRCIALDEWA